MNRILYLNADLKHRRLEDLRKARKRIKYAVGYLNELLSRFDTHEESKRQILARDVEDLLEDARRYVRRGRKAGRPRRTK